MTHSTTISQHKKERETKGLILEIAEGLFSLYGYVGVSMRSIAEALGISKPALYYHFKNKQELYFEVLNQASKELIESLQQVIGQNVTLQRKFHGVITTYIDYCINKKDMVHLMMQEVSKQDKEIMDSISKISNEILDLLEPLIKEILKESQKIKRVNSRFVTHLFIGIMNSFIISQSLSGRKKYNSKQIADQLIALSMNN